MQKPVGTAGLLRVGVIGLGVGEQLARAFAMHPAATVVALCDRDVEKCARLDDLMPDARRYRRAADLIDDQELDAVVVASHDDDHYLQVIRALERGLHVFSEKPLCLGTAELEHIVRAWKASGKRLTTNTVLRRSARFRWLHDALQSGRLGDVFCVEADYVYGRLHKLVDGWRGKIPDYSATLGGAIHLVDLVLWLTGERPVEVAAAASSRGSRGTGFVGNDLVSAILYFDSGMVARVGANFASVHPHHHRLTVFGTQGTFENAAIGPALLWTSRDEAVGPDLVTAAYPGVRKGDLVPAFVDAIQGAGEPDVIEREVFAAMSVCLAIDRAAADREVTTVEYFGVE